MSLSLRPLKAALSKEVPSGAYCWIQLVFFTELITTSNYSCLLSYPCFLFSSRAVAL